MTRMAFVSSTPLDLGEHRAYVIEALREAGVHVDPMEDWTADTGEPKQISQNRLDGCDLCVLLVGLRRGHVAQGDKLSITQLEVAEAEKRGIDVLVFMLRENAPWPHEFDELDADPGVRAWREELSERKTVSFFETAPDSVEIKSALSRWLQQRDGPRDAERREAKRRLRRVVAHLPKRVYSNYDEVHGRRDADSVERWDLGRLIEEGWGEEIALRCRYEDLDRFVLSETDRQNDERVKAAEEDLLGILRILEGPD